MAAREFAIIAVMLEDAGSIAIKKHLPPALDATAGPQAFRNTAIQFASINKIITLLS
jgi:hypothetical protein